MTWEDRMAECKAWQQHCKKEAPVEDTEREAQPWPWAQLETLAGKLSAELAEGVKQIMADVGETGEELAAIRRQQVAFSIQARNRGLKSLGWSRGHE